MNSVIEIWKTIPEFPTYEASNKGRIRRKSDHHYPNLANCYNGLRVNFYVNGKRYNRPVKRIIGRLFLDNTYKLKNILHRDGDPANCSANNLYYTNKQGKGCRGYGIVGEDSNFAKLKDEDVAYILISKLSGYKLAQLFNISHSNIYMIRHGKRWPHFQKLSYDELKALADNVSLTESDMIYAEMDGKTAYTAKNVKQKVKVVAKENAKIPVRIDNRTVIFINKGENKQKAINRYLERQKQAS